MALTGLATLLLALGAPARADDWPEKLEHQNGYIYDFLPQERWGKLTADDARKRFYLVGRWQQVYGDSILLYKAKGIRRFLRLSPGPLKDQLTNNLASNGGQLAKRRSTVQIMGSVARLDDQVFLKIERVDKLPDDAERYREALTKLANDPDKIHALAEDCRARAVRYEDPELGAMVREITRRELDVRSQQLGADDHRARLELASRYRKEVGDSSGAINLYATVHEAEGAPKELVEFAAKQLRVLRAVRVRIDQVNWSWVTHEEFKRSEGYIQRQDQDGVVRWVRRELAELRDAIGEERKRQANQVDSPRSDPFKCAKDARSGKVRRGQTFAEVRRAVGFPQQVYHLWAPLNDKKNEQWTQWVMSSGTRIYFVNGWAISKRTSATPWPAN
ncbi:MAG TPA: hypothetical protein DEA08_27585 [Planctomycetes bacterium]|nr:hypothetical protein [Planctomycetota bacterium]